MSLGRRAAGFILSIAALPSLTWLLLALDSDLSLSTDIVAFLLLVVVVALVGGLFPALLAAVGGFLLLNYFFTPPVQTFSVAKREDLVALFRVPRCSGLPQYRRRRRCSSNPGSVAGSSGGGHPVHPGRQRTARLTGRCPLSSSRSAKHSR